MGCSYEVDEEKYEFFIHIDDYIKYDDLEVRNEEIHSYNLNFNFIQEHYKQHGIKKDDDEQKIQKLTEMFKKFVYLCESLFNRNGGTTFNDNYDIDFLNYWLNSRIREIDSDTICKEDFFKNFMVHNRSKGKLIELNGKIHDINESELKKLDALYTLHKFYNKIISSLDSKKEEVIKHANYCVKQYATVKDNCPDNRTNFCDKLNSFQQKYEAIGLCNYNLEKWKKEKLPSLTGENAISIQDCGSSANATERPSDQVSGAEDQGIGETSNNDMNNITIGAVSTIGISFISFIFYRFTSFGPWIRSRISNNENILGNLGEDMNHFSPTSEYDHIDSENMSYNIVYNSV
ncbi:PIR Superfamily Protein [Plasmodium ovale wallikeri]|uniref:PIR Superfamily Protein n=1 Tax=Plasmodium ovale wallikeri TaxID=864142 RepID=A0A1A8YMH2_PLAOA|nr:PIR Superfamily Protein [Plasmodium ovale wallikeri]